MQITVVLPLSRIWMLDIQAEQIRQNQIAGYDIHTLVICDNIDIKKWQIEDAFRELNHTIVYTENEPTTETNIYSRRQRITDIYNLSRYHIRTNDQYVWTLEDDTLIPPDTLKRLLTHTQKKVGLISGIQAGRHAFKIVGLWNANIHLDLPRRLWPDPIRYETPPYQTQGTSYIHASGLYCMLTQAKLYRTTPFRHHHLGPDFYYGWDIHKQGYYNLADWTIICGHQTQNHTIWPDQDCIPTRWNVQANGELWPETPKANL